MGNTLRHPVNRAITSHGCDAVVTLQLPSMSPHTGSFSAGQSSVCFPNPINNPPLF